MSGNIYIYIFVMAGVTYLIRLLPLALIRGDIKNIYVRSFLYYVPFVTLSVMTFPAMLETTESLWPGLTAFAAAILLAYMRKSLFYVSAASCLVVFLVELVIG